MNQTIDWFTLSYTVLGGLGVFFFGMKMLSEKLQAASTQLIRRIINSLTNNRVTALGVGLVITMIVQSSSISTVMVVGFVNAGLMNLAQAIGVIFGANIGTTITGWIITIKIGKYSLLLIGLGFFPMLFAKNEKLATWGGVSFALGMIFLGLQTMSEAFLPLRSSADFISLMAYFSADSYASLWAVIGIGCGLTFIIQSSSAMLGITIALAVSGSINFQTAAALVLGENIGTTITALLAGVGGNVAAKRAAAAHAIFNTLGVFAISFFFWRYLGLIESIVPGLADAATADGSRRNIAAHIATSHTVFNVINALIFLPLLKPLAKLVSWLIPDASRKEKRRIKLLGNTRTLSPELALDQAYGELAKMGDMVYRALKMTSQYVGLTSDGRDLRKKILKYESITDNMKAELMVFMSNVMRAKLYADQPVRVESVLRVTDEFESIADYCQKIVHHRKRLFDFKHHLDEKTSKELFDLVTLAEEAFKETIKFVQIRGDGPQKSKPDFISLYKQVDSKRLEYLERIKEAPQVSATYLGVADALLAIRRILSHTRNIIEIESGHKIIQKTS